MKSICVRCGVIAVLGWLAVVLLASCGGGGATVASGVGSGGTGAGTVSGFGSVIVDDVRYDDTDAGVSKETPDGIASAATVMLGQQVRVDFEGSDKAHSILIRPQLVGVVTQLTGTDHWRSMGSAFSS